MHILSAMSSIDVLISYGMYTWETLAISTLSSPDRSVDRLDPVCDFC
jgi:hypothetical protein